MKNIFFASTFLLASLTIHAQSKEAAVVKRTTAQVTQTQKPASVAAQDLKEIQASDLPKPVLEAIARDYKGAAISKAYTNEKGEFKLILATADNANHTVYANSKGEWIKKQ